MKPTRYFVTYEDMALYERLAARYGTEDTDPAYYNKHIDFPRLKDAMLFAHAQQGYAEVVERRNMRDETPYGDVGLVWEWDESVVWQTGDA
jgi:acyl-homoserine lactone acylase PvdQ